MAKSPNGEAAKEGPSPLPSPTIRDAIRKDLSWYELQALIDRELKAIILRKLRANGFPCLPVAKLNVVGES